MLTKRQIMNYIPKSKQAAVYDAWEDEDGIWIMLNEGWNADRMDSVCRTIHEGGGGDDEPRRNVFKQLRYQIAGIRKL